MTHTDIFKHLFTTQGNMHPVGSVVHIWVFSAQFSTVFWASISSRRS